jgi:hypothetical protein
MELNGLVCDLIRRDTDASVAVWPLRLSVEWFRVISHARYEPEGERSKV